MYFCLQINISSLRTSVENKDRRKSSFFLGLDQSLEDSALKYLQCQKSQLEWISQRINSIIYKKN